MNDGQMSGGLVERLEKRATAIEELDEIAVKIGEFPIRAMMIDARLHREAASSIKSQSRDEHRELIDLERVRKWAYSKPRKPAVTAFTEGPERQVAYMIEEAQSRDEVLEEAARVCRAIQRTMTENGNKATDAAIKDQWEFHAVGAGACAAEIEAIRSLKSISAEQRDKGHLAGGE